MAMRKNTGLVDRSGSDIILEGMIEGATEWSLENGLNAVANWWNDDTPRAVTGDEIHRDLNHDGHLSEDELEQTSRERDQSEASKLAAAEGGVVINKAMITLYNFWHADFVAQHNNVRNVVLARARDLDMNPLVLYATMRQQVPTPEIVDNIEALNNRVGAKCDVMKHRQVAY